MGKIQTLSLYSPGNCAPELLERMLVGQHKLLDMMVRSVIDSVQTGAGIHWLLIGPRGTGKSHLLALAFSRINLNPAIRPRIAMAYMKEEELGVATFLDWLVQILRALERHDPTPELKRDLEILTTIPLEEVEAVAQRLLIKHVGHRRLLLIAENLGQIFDDKKGMGRQGQQKFRDIIQNYPFWTILASNQALFEDIQSHAAPFYGFFKVHHLASFTLEQALELLGNLAREEGKEELREHLRSPAGLGRVRAIHEITGGSPRLLVLFYQFIQLDTLEELSVAFLEMVDSLTSYYQEQMHPLSAQQQKIIAFLSDRRCAITVKEIAAGCFITHPTCSTQLKRLSDLRFVQSTSHGRESYYELSEPLLRLCFEIKKNMGYPIQLFVDFLGRYYSLEELRGKYRSGRLMAGLLEDEASGETGRLKQRLQYIGEAIKAYHPSERGWLERLSDVPESVELSECTSLAEELIAGEDRPEAARLMEVAAKCLGGSKLELGNSKSARDFWRKVVELRPENVRGWANLGFWQLLTGQLAESLQSFQRAAELSPKDAPTWVLFKLLEIKYSGNPKELLEHLQRAESMGLTCAASRALTGDIWRLLGHYDEAIAHYQEAIRLDPEECSPLFNIALALIQKGNLQAGLDQMERALTREGSKWDGMVELSLYNIQLVLLREAPLEALPGLLSREQAIFEGSEYHQAFLDGLMGAIMEMLSLHDEIPLARLTALRGVVEGLAGIEDLKVACRLFDAAVRYLESKDLRVLLQLPLEERRKVQDVLGLPRS